MSLFHAMLTRSILSPTNVNILNLLFFFQIRAEKAYYIADPEVDSLVSWKLFCVLYGQLDILSFYSKKNIPFCLQHWADILCWQQKAKNLMKMHTHLHQPLRIILRKSFCDRNGSQIGKHFKQHYEHGSILCGKRKFSLLFKFKLPVNPRILYIPFSNSILGTKGRELKDKWCRILLRLRVQARMNSFLKHKMLLQYE